jgi:cytidylate kinase
MKDLFLKYMSAMPGDIEPDQIETGPVITISREYGCYGTGFARKLAEKINAQYKPKKQWKTVDRHVLNRVADELHADPSYISHVFGAEQRGFLTDIVDSFSSKKYTSDYRVIATIKKVVRNFAEEGNCIIVGRAGCVIASHIPRSLHIKLIGTYDYRINAVMQHLGINEKDAAKHIEEVTRRREQFMAFFNGNKPDSDIFDVVFNKSKMSEDAIMGCIIDACKSKNII